MANDIWSYEIFVYFYLPDALPGTTLGIADPLFALVINTRFLLAPRKEVVDQDPASGSLYVEVYTIKAYTT